MGGFDARGLFGAGLFVFLLAACGGSEDSPSLVEDSLTTEQDAWRDDVERWREGRLARLTAEDGWLALMALAFPGDGRWTVGQGEEHDLPVISGPELWGVLEIEAGQAWFEAADPAVRIEGDLSGRVQILDAEASDSLAVAADSGRFRVQRRPSGLAYRARDALAPTRQAFRGIEHFPVDPAWRIEARWDAHQPERELLVANVLGELIEEVNPGRAVFELNGQRFALEAVAADAQLFFIFADRTSGRETYGLGRFLYTDLPDNGRVVLDFNRAYNPPCAFTAFTSCPLPPQENRLDLRVEAGELAYAED